MIKTDQKFKFLHYFVPSMKSRVILVPLILFLFAYCSLSVSVVATQIEPDYQVGDILTYKMRLTGGTGKFQVDIEMINISANAINVSFYSYSDGSNYIIGFGENYHHSNWTSDTTFENISMQWEEIGDGALMANAASLLDGFVVFPDLGQSYVLCAVDSSEWNAYNITINNRGLLESADIRLSGNSYSIQSSITIPGFPIGLLLLTGAGLVSGLMVIMQRKSKLNN